MSRIARTATGLLTAAVLVGAAAPAAAQTADDLFGTGTIHEIRLFINSKDLHQLRTRYEENVYYTADLVWGRLRVRNAAVRVRGRATRSAAKPSLRVDFDRYVTGQRFLGLRSLVLDNGLQDPSLMREPLAMAVFARMGLASSRESFCRLYINNVEHGLYTIVEAIEPEFLTRTLQDAGGYLFEYHYPGRYYGEDLGDDLSAYAALYEPRTHRLESAVSLYGPIRELFGEVNQPIDAVWRDRVGRYLDLEAFVTYLAIDTFLSDNDGLVGFHGMNNFYVYRPAGTTVHRFIPWDKDLAVGDVEFPVFNRLEENALSRGAMSFPDLRALYVDALRRCAQLALEDGWMAAEVSRLSALLRPAAFADRLKPYTNEEVEATFQDLARFAEERPRFVVKALAGIDAAASR
jgi:spore coat protein CotH